MNQMIDEMIKKIIEHTREWLGKDADENVIIIDPLDNKAIGSHYSLSHYGVALYIYGSYEGNKEIKDIGIQVIEGMLNRWTVDSNENDFHNDFNNFALCVLAQYIEEYETYSEHSIHNRLKKIIMSTEDSRHNTINWIPMRIFVNIKRYSWTKKIQYKNKINQLENLILQATNRDGFIEDRLPKGVSYNLQYNISTLSLLTFLMKYGEEFDINQSVAAINMAIDPEGDINYMGRGSNQIFAWGPWIYLLKRTHQTENMDNALLYLNNKLNITLKNNNLYLNDFEGKEKYLWWDYHYTSVYTAHLLFWLVLSKYEKNKIELKKCELNHEDTGLMIKKSELYFIVVFNGRKEYLAERGPNLVNLWINKYGQIFKGGFGPRLGSFGNKYSTDITVLLNYVGPIIIQQKKNQSTLLHKFPEIELNHVKNKLYISFTFTRRVSAIFNLPIYKQNIQVISDIKVIAEKEPVTLVSCGILKNQYGEHILHQSPIMKAKTWILEIEL